MQDQTEELTENNALKSPVRKDYEMNDDPTPRKSDVHMEKNKESSNNNGLGGKTFDLRKSLD